MAGSRRIVVVASNISEQKGGEAIKAFQFIRHLIDNGVPVSAITHERSADEVRKAFPGLDLHVIPDDWVQWLFWYGRVLRHMADSVFFVRIRPVIRTLAAAHPGAVFHYMVPVSPMVPRFPVGGVVNVLGPITGNIHYPPAFRAEEPWGMRIGGRLHRGVQRLLGILFDDKRRFDRVLVSGGERTRRSLAWAGCREEDMANVVDSGISDTFRSRPLIRHEGVNHVFMTSGRLVPHKGVWLTIEALPHTREPVRFDIYGRGKQQQELAALAERLGVSDRVRFLGWMTSHDALIERMAEYRAYMVPSLAEANGIVVQEAMMAGLPAVCLKWGGPAMLADDESAVLIEPVSRRHVVLELAKAMDRLATDPGWANRLAGNARRIAEQRFPWPQAAREWRSHYPGVAEADQDALAGNVLMDERCASSPLATRAAPNPS